uniref:SJCHGC07126 protein n=1 Tax=Schistosoma japonicum TaxID=6182 RepID=Q5BRX0_SCHJA|nr:SJCHGC07126 protein [Schistosoma japonicum]
MLLDLSDAVGVNVYILGRVYADLKKRLNLAIPDMGQFQTDYLFVIFFIDLYYSYFL